jgi:hypothetical protein
LGAGYRESDIDRAYGRGVQDSWRAESNTRVHLRPLRENAAVPGGVEETEARRQQSMTITMHRQRLVIGGSSE